MSVMYEKFVRKLIMDLPLFAIIRWVPLLLDLRFPQVALNLVFPSILSLLAALMSADVARNL